MAPGNDFELSMPGESKLWQMRRDEAWVIQLPCSDAQEPVPVAYRFPKQACHLDRFPGPYPNPGNVWERLKQAYNLAGSRRLLGKNDCCDMQTFRAHL